MTEPIAKPPPFVSAEDVVEHLKRSGSFDRLRREVRTDLESRGVLERLRNRAREEAASVFRDRLTSCGPGEAMGGGRTSMRETMERKASALAAATERVSSDQVGLRQEVENEVALTLGSRTLLLHSRVSDAYCALLRGDRGIPKPSLVVAPPPPPVVVATKVSQKKRKKPGSPERRRKHLCRFCGSVVAVQGGGIFFCGKCRKVLTAKDAVQQQEEKGEGEIKSEDPSAVAQVATAAAVPGSLKKRGAETPTREDSESGSTSSSSDSDSASSSSSSDSEPEELSHGPEETRKSETVPVVEVAQPPGVSKITDPPAPVSEPKKDSVEAGKAAEDPPVAESKVEGRPDEPEEKRPHTGPTPEVRELEKPAATGLVEGDSLKVKEDDARAAEEPRHEVVECDDDQVLFKPEEDDVLAPVEPDATPQAQQDANRTPLSLRRKRPEDVPSCESTS